jgi:hypothetical protein
MTDPIPDPLTKLATFTAPAPNRDELLFAAGKASARVGRWWKLATGLLAVAQAVTLAAWLWPTGETTPTPILPTPTPVVPVPPATPEPYPEEPTPLDPHSYLALMHRDDAPEPRERLAPGPIRQTPTLTAGSRRFE